MSSDSRILGDILEPTCVLCFLRDDPYDWTGKTPSFVLEKEDGTAITETGTITAHPTQAFTAGTGDDANYLRCNAHGVKSGQQVVLATSGTLPTGLTATRYYAVEVQPNAFKVAKDSPNGAAVAITAGSGSGSHTFYVVGSVQISYAAADINATVPYRLWIVSTFGGKTLSFPSTRAGIAVNVEPFGN